jgi:hypothetical protein
MNGLSTDERRAARSARVGRARRRRWLTWTVAVVAIAALGVTGVVLVLNRVSPSPAAEPSCTAVLDQGAWKMSPAQADNAALITAVSLRRGMPARAATIGLATALQESRLLNIDYGDRDSVGLFQQRPSQGWGTVEQIMDPVYSTNAFYDELETVAGYTELPVTEAAQAVQRSGFPDAYAQHEVRSRAWAAALTGQTHASLTCMLDTVDDSARIDPSDAATVDTALTALEQRVARDFGELPISRSGDSDLLVDVSSLPGDAAGNMPWAIGQWGVATAFETHVERVTVGQQVWSRETGEWTTDESIEAEPASVARLSLARD